MTRAKAGGESSNLTAPQGRAFIPVDRSQVSQRKSFMSSFARCRVKAWGLAVAVAVVALCGAMKPSQADVALPSVFASNMVLQREMPIAVWGTATAGEKVSVTFGKSKAEAVAGKDGKWSTKLPAQKANSQPEKLVVKGKNTLTLDNVLVGEVWLCSGQSNMEWMVRITKDGAKEIAAANHPQIRLFHVSKVPSQTAQADVKLTSSWVECSPKTVPNFSAVAYYFGRKLQKELNVPVGLINSSWGGTRIDPWITPAALKANKSLANVSQQAEVLKKELPKNFNLQYPTALYNGMIHGLVPFTFRGAIWYQGESNLGEGMLYHEKMKALISGWRDVFHNPEMPFIYVQLAPYRYNAATRLPEIWEAQTATLTYPNTGMAVTVDISTVGNIHPPNKQDVGLRLALWALAKTYGKKDIVYSGPLYKSMKAEGSKIRVTFDHVGGGLVARDGKPLSHFEVAGKDGKFVAAEAVVDGETVVVSSKSVADPVAVRFGWNELAEPNLSNKEGLPASPFRSNGK